MMPRVLIFGCGFLGEAAADLFLDRGWSVLAVSRHLPARPTSGDRSAEFVALDITDPVAVAQTAAKVGPGDVLIHCASTRGGDVAAYRAVYLSGIQNVTAAWPGAFPIFVSSTSVYGQLDGSEVDETSPTDPVRDTGQVLLEAERVALRAGGAAVRLGGIYGPGRSVLLRKFLDGTARLEGDGSRIINQIHRRDAAAALLRIAETRADGIFNGVDDFPAPQREVYAWIAEAVGRPMPLVGEPDFSRKRGWTSKRVRNARLRALGWHPAYPCYRDALPELLASAPG